MSTNAIIEVEGIGYAKVYKHWDGDEESTLPWLTKFNKDFAASRGDDPEYKMAQLLRSSARDAKEFNLDDSIHTGWGLVAFGDDFEGFITYTLHSDGTVTVR